MREKGVQYERILACLTEQSQTRRSWHSQELAVGKPTLFAVNIRRGGCIVGVNLSPVNDHRWPDMITRLRRPNRQSIAETQADQTRLAPQYEILCGQMVKRRLCVNQCAASSCCLRKLPHALH